MNEFDIIANYFAPLSQSCNGAMGLKDDAALLRINDSYELVATKDALVENVHFFKHDTPANIASKLIRVNLSDLAAMGAKPLGYLLALVMPRNTDEAWLKAFSDSLANECHIFGGALLGGDTVTHDGPLTLTLTALGAVKRDQAFRRAGAKEGELIYVSGTIGDSFLGLNILKKELKNISPEAEKFLTRRYHIPQPRITLGRKLKGIATACTDISDGLAADLGHICECSGVGADITIESVPLSNAARNILSSHPELHPQLLSGGDDYELIFTAGEDKKDDIARIATTLGLPLTAIGRITAGSKVRVLDATGKEVHLSKKGYTHT